jgi:hypothetical protein
MAINKFDVYEEIYLDLCIKADMLKELKYFEERQFYIEIIQNIWQMLPYEYKVKYIKPEYKDYIKNYDL